MRNCLLNEESRSFFLIIYFKWHTILETPSNVILQELHTQKDGKSRCGEVVTDIFHLSVHQIDGDVSPFSFSDYLKACKKCNDPIGRVANASS